MYRMSKSAGWGLAIASLALLAGASAWIGYSGSGPSVAKDYEECADEAKTNASSDTEYSKQIMPCGERFAGRRKAGGGYAYFDFMQNRTFDIAGPNPSTDERKQIDSAYMEFLGAQRRGTGRFRYGSPRYRAALGSHSQGPASDEEACHRAF